MGKRIFDISATLVVLPILIPLFIIIGVLIKFDSSGPIFYRGVRAGWKGRVFSILKFRTMVQNAEQLGSATTALNDFRITNFGFFLRKYKLDELPQIINVLLGEMSIVGPRPEIIEYANKYKGEEKLILSMRPGITDYSSIKYSSLDELVGESDANRVFNEKILDQRTALRLKYVKEYTFLKDINIIILTFKAILYKMKNKSLKVKF